MSMPTVATRESYFETGLEILADRGLGGLKLAELCGRLGVTTGSFYHHFSGWQIYTRELVRYWMHDRTVRLALEIKGAGHLLEDQPALAASIKSRFSYLDPLNHLQVEMMRLYRGGQTDERTVRAIHLSINGLSAGLRNSG